MSSHTSMRIAALGLIVVAAGAGAYWLSRPETTPPIVGVVLATEVRIAPEVDGQLTAIKMRRGSRPGRRRRSRALSDRADGVGRAGACGTGCCGC